MDHSNSDMRSLIRLVEAFEQDVAEEFVTEPMKVGMWTDSEPDDRFRDADPALPMKVTATVDIPAMYMSAGDTLYLEPTNNLGEVYSEENGMTYDWDFISHLIRNRDMLELEMVSGEKPEEEVPFEEGYEDGEDFDKDMKSGYPGNLPDCSYCDDEEPLDGFPCLNCGSKQHIESMSEGDKPYATMKDGPDKYLFRKDGKQKLVGSADNEPDEGEEELEEIGAVVGAVARGAAGVAKKVGSAVASGVKAVANNAAKDRVMSQEPLAEAPGDIYNIDGYIYRQEEIEDAEGFYKKLHYLITPEGEEVYIDYSPYQDMDKDEFAAKVAAHRKGTMDKDIREMQIAAGIITEEHGDCEECADCKCDPCECEKEAVEEGELPDALKQYQFGKKDDDADDNSDDSDDSDDDADDKSDDDKEEVDEDVMSWMKRFNNLDGVVNEDCDESEDAAKNDDGECSPFTHADENVAMVREDDVEEDVAKEDMLVPPKDAGYQATGDVRGSRDPYDDDDGNWDNSGNVSVRTEPELDRQTDFDAPPRNDGDDSFDMTEDPSDDDDRIIDVGDDEDYEVHDFDSEFEAEMGNTNRFEGMYEMNELRKLAGLEQIVEKDVVDGADAADGEDESVEVEEGFENDSAVSGVIGYEIADERAYYLMADILGAELDFGPQDEILVPVERDDEVRAELTKQGFEQGKDFAVAGQMMDDLQNGYNDRAFTKGSDYFPGGATSSPSHELGPAGAKQGDNPMRTAMTSVDKEDEIYENMKLSYRRHRQSDIAAPKKSSVVTEDLSLASIAFDLAAGAFIGWSLVTAWPKVKEYLETKQYVNVLADFEEQVSPETMKNFADKLEAKLISTHPNSRKAIAGRLKSIEAKLNAIPNTETYHGLVRAIELLRGEMKRAEQFVKKSNTGHGRRAAKKRR